MDRCKRIVDELLVTAARHEANGKILLAAKLYYKASLFCPGKKPSFIALQKLCSLVTTDREVVHEYVKNVVASMLKEVDKGNIDVFPALVAASMVLNTNWIVVSAFRRLFYADIERAKSVFGFVRQVLFSAGEFQICVACSPSDTVLNALKRSAEAQGLSLRASIGLRQQARDAVAGLVGALVKLGRHNDAEGIFRTAIAIDNDAAFRAQMESHMSNENE